MKNESALQSASSADIEANILDYLKQQDAGTAPTPTEWIARHPTLADELRLFFDLNADTGFQQIRQTAPPRAFGDFRDLQFIGKGGMGVVYKAFQLSLQRTVALKMIRDQHLADAETRDRFVTEARNVTRLEHPTIVKIYQLGEYQNQPYFAMEYIAGGNLADCIQPGHPLAKTLDEQREVVRLLKLVAEAVHHAHQRGIIHRDLKPANILLGRGTETTPKTVKLQALSTRLTISDKDPLPAAQTLSTPTETVAPRVALQLVKPYVTDFGLAQRSEEQSPNGEGAIVGTPPYMSPEQAQGKADLTTAVDVYGLGAILYETLTGTPPFLADSTIDLLLKVINDPPEPPRKKNKTVDRDLERICLKCLEKDPANRYPSAQALAEDLQNWLDGMPFRYLPVGRIERLTKWVRRRPSVATLATTVCLLTLGSLITFAVLWKKAVDEQETSERLFYITRRFPSLV